MATIDEISNYLMRPPPTPYEQTNPFKKFFRRGQARRAAQREFNPYYKEIGKLAGTDRRRFMNRSVQDRDISLADIGVRRGYAGEDYATGLADINMGRTRAGEDRTTSLNRLGENRSFQRTGEDQSYNPMVEGAMNNLALSGRTFGGRRGQVMGQLGAQRDLRIGGINTEYNRGAADTESAYSRAMQDFSTAETGLGTARDRSLYGLGQEDAATRQGFQRSRQDYTTGFKREKLGRRREQRTAVTGEIERRRGIKREQWNRQADRYYQNY